MTFKATARIDTSKAGEMTWPKANTARKYSNVATKDSTQGQEAGHHIHMVLVAHPGDSIEYPNAFCSHITVPTIISDCTC